MSIKFGMPTVPLLGAYLRARRELLVPADVGLHEGLGSRRVPGLRRSEVAALAGISTEYYVKLEQGQEANPTNQVLESLARALKLDATATSYLYSLVHPVAPRSESVSLSALQRAQWLISSWPMTAAMILSRYNDIVAVNALQAQLVAAYRPGGNALVSLLTDSRMRNLYADWEGLSTRSVALLRSQVALDPGGVRGQQLVAQLNRESDLFRDVWHRHDIGGMKEGTHPMVHPDVGPLELHFAHLPLMGTDGHSIFLYFAEPGSDAERALAQLAGR